MSLLKLAAEYMRKGGMSDAAILEAIVGLSAELELRSAYEMAPRDEQAERRRAKDRERKRLSRTSGTPQISAESADVQGAGRHKENSTPIRNTSSSEAKASSEGACAPDCKPGLWGEDGLGKLLSLGMAERDARKHIGKWLKMTRDDPLALIEAIGRAVTARAFDPVPFVTACLQQTGPPRGGVARFPQKPSAYETAQHIARSIAAAQPEPPARGGPGDDDDRVFQAGQRGLSPPSGDGDYLDAGPVSARSY